MSAALLCVKLLLGKPLFLLLQKHLLLAENELACSISPSPGDRYKRRSEPAPNGLGLVNMPYTKPNPKPTLPLGAAQPTCAISPSHLEVSSSHLEVSGLQRYILGLQQHVFVVAHYFYLFNFFSAATQHFCFNLYE